MLGTPNHGPRVTIHEPRFTNHEPQPLRKIIFINRYFYPDHSATSQLLSDLAFHLVGNSFETHVVASRQSYDDSKAVLPPKEIIRGVHVHRVWSTRFGRHNNYGRAIDYLSFYVTSTLCLLRITRRDDVVVAKTDPPLTSVPAAIVTKIKSAHLVNWLQDLFPEVAEKLGIRFIRGPLYFTLKWLRNRCLHMAKQNIVIGEKMAEHLRNEGVPDDKITIIDNWVDGEQVRPVAPEANELRKEWGVQDKYVVGYSGNLGRAHDFSTILNAAEMLRNDTDIVFIFIGGGVKLESVKKQCHKRGLSNVLFKPYQPREELSESLSLPDVHLISLNPALEGLIVPSKFYGVLSVNRPMVFIGDKEGEIARKLKKHGCGLTVDEGDAASLVAVIKKLSSDRGFRERLSVHSRGLCDGTYGLKASISKWKVMFNTQFGLQLLDEMRDCKI